MVINRVANSLALQIAMMNGHLEFERKDVNMQGYREFINTVVGYATDVLGKQVVKKEMLIVDRFVGAGTLELITQMDLRIFTAD